MTELIVLAAACAAGWYFRAQIIAFFKSTFGGVE